MIQTFTQQQQFTTSCSDNQMDGIELHLNVRDQVFCEQLRFNLNNQVILPSQASLENIFSFAKENSSADIAEGKRSY